MIPDKYINKQPVAIPMLIQNALGWPDNVYMQFKEGGLKPRPVKFQRIGKNKKEFDSVVEYLGGPLSIYSVILQPKIVLNLKKGLVNVHLYNHIKTLLIINNDKMDQYWSIQIPHPTDYISTYELHNGLRSLLVEAFNRITLNLIYDEFIT